MTKKKESPQKKESPPDLIDFSLDSSILPKDIMMNGHLKQDDTTKLFEEIADDMLHLMEQMRRNEKRLKDMEHSLHQTTEILSQSIKSSRMELDKLKDSLFSEKKAFLARSTLNAILPALESLEILGESKRGDRRDMDPDQISVLSNMLRNIIQSLGYTRFAANAGDSFDPGSMECLDYAEGNSGVVVRTINAGYRAGETVIKPCGVVLGKQNNHS